MRANKKDTVNSKIISKSTPQIRHDLGRNSSTNEQKYGDLYIADWGD